MKKLNLFSVTVLIMILLFAPAPVHAQDIPTSHDFGDVIVGESAVTIITLTYNGLGFLEVNSITIYGSGDFSQTPSITPPFSLGYQESVDIEVVFAPSAEGLVYAELVIMNGDMFIVLLSGTGVSEIPPPDPTIQDILVFFDVSVANGTLFGVGPNNSGSVASIQLFAKIFN